jgi:hypothetical protein
VPSPRWPRPTTVLAEPQAEHRASAPAPRPDLGRASPLTVESAARSHPPQLHLRTCAGGEGRCPGGEVEAVRSLPWVRGMSITLRQRLLGWLKQTERSTSHASTQRTSTAQARRQKPEPDATTPRPRIRSNTVGGVALAWPSDFSHHVRHGPSCSHERDTASLRCARPAAGVPRLSRRTLTHPSHLRFGGKGRESDTDSERPEDGLAALLHRRRFVYVLPSPQSPPLQLAALPRWRRYAALL